MRSGVPPVFCLDIISKVKRGSSCDASWRPVLPMSAGVGRALPLRFHTRARRASSLLASQRQRIPRTRWYSGLPTQPVKLLQSITTPFAPQRVQHVHSRLPSSRPRLTSLLTHHPGRNTPIEPSPPLGSLELADRAIGCASQNIPAPADRKARATDAPGRLAQGWAVVSAACQETPCRPSL